MENIFLEAINLPHLNKFLSRCYHGGSKTDTYFMSFKIYEKKKHFFFFTAINLLLLRKSIAVTSQSSFDKWQIRLWNLAGLCFFFVSSYLVIVKAINRLIMKPDMHILNLFSTPLSLIIMTGPLCPRFQSTVPAQRVTSDLLTSAVSSILIKKSSGI